MPPPDWKMPPLRHRANDTHPSSSSYSSSSNPSSSSQVKVAFGRDLRRLFNFAPDYTPLNHGSFGTYPRNILEHRTQLLRDWEARECIYNLHTYPVKLRESRAAVAPLLGVDVHVDEVVLVANATTGVNVILRNLRYEEGDVILYPSTVYDSCLKTVCSLEETSPVKGYEIEYEYPIEDDELVALFSDTIKRLQKTGKRVRVAVFDTIVSKPGVRVPWERLVQLCREMGVLSLVDGAHAIGHIDMTHTGRVKPDFLVTNCHKWLFTPRGCAVLYVPFTNHHLFTTALPTSHGYSYPSQRSAKSPTEYFTELFSNGSTLDVTPYLTIPEALRFRTEFCGGEAAIREYCARLAREAGDMVATSLRTEVLDNKSGSLREGCAFANVRLPITVIPERIPEGISSEDEDEDNSEGVAVNELPQMLSWFYHVAAQDFDTYLQTFYYAGAIWVRFSAQVYLDSKDFVWAAGTIKELCVRVKSGEWRGWEGT